jgi:hypothetical protein
MHGQQNIKFVPYSQPELFSSPVWQGWGTPTQQVSYEDPNVHRDNYTFYVLNKGKIRLRRPLIRRHENTTGHRAWNMSQDDRIEVKFRYNVAGISLSDLDMQFRGQKLCHSMEWHCQSAMYTFVHVCFIVRTFVPVRTRAFLFQTCPPNVIHVSQESCPFQSWWKLSLVTLTAFYLSMKAQYNKRNSSFNGLCWLSCNYL